MTPDDFKDIRLRMGLTQREIGDALDVSKHTVRKWEKGERGIRKPMQKLVRNLVDKFEEGEGK